LQEAVKREEFLKLRGRTGVSLIITTTIIIIIIIIIIRAQGVRER